MNRRRIIILFAVALVFIALLWLLWVNPKSVDMAQFGPANSLLYFESNAPADVLMAIANTDVWKLVNQDRNAPQLSFGAAWWRGFVRVTGIGPIRSVIMSRSQLAVVVTSFGTTESGDTLNVKPEAALIIETHTLESRIRAPVEGWLETFVKATFPTSRAERSVVDGVGIVEWRESNGNGHLVVAFIGSVVVVGNSRQVVERCIAVARRRAPSLKSNTELLNARTSLKADNALIFGYVPAENSSKLVSTGIPILLGQAPADLQFQHLAENAASKVIGSLAWTSRTFKGGIEDRYEISVAPEVLNKLTPHFGPPTPASPFMTTTDFYSISQYQLEGPLAAWQELKAAISGRVDTLAAVVFNTTLKTSLSTYGIEDPEIFLGAVKSPLNTLRLDPDGERQLLVATVTDRDKLLRLFGQRMRVKSRSANDPATFILENLDGSQSVALNATSVVIGHPVDVQQYYQLQVELAKQANKQRTRVTYFLESESAAHVLTLTNDSERVRGSILAIMKGSNREMSPQVDSRLNELPYAVTQTTLTRAGLTRITRSPLGQFSAIIPLFIPQGTHVGDR